MSALSRVGIYVVLAAIFVIGLLWATSGDDAKESAYPNPRVIKNYKAGTIITGSCTDYGPLCIDYADLTFRQKLRCFTFRDDTYDSFCARIRVPRSTALPAVNDYALEGSRDPRIRARLRVCPDTWASCYYPITVRGVRTHPCAEVKKAFDRMTRSMPPDPTKREFRYPGCSDHGSVARLNSIFRDTQARADLVRSFKRFETEFEINW